MKQQPTCRHCGSKLPPDTPAGNCPVCLLGLAFALEDTSSTEAASSSLRQLGHSLLHRKLGEGGAGVVWLALDISLNRWEAVKVVKPAFQKRNQLVERLRQEAQILAKLNHPNIITVYGVGEEDCEFYICMEYLERGSLQDELDQNGRLTWQDATVAIKDSACGLAAAHATGVIHRDIKPGNLFRTESGVTKVGDFGVARIKAATSMLTQAGQIIGTPSFIAPEQIPVSTSQEASDRPSGVDARTDLYSLACTYYALLTGHPPFDPPSESPPRDLVLYRHLHEPFPPAEIEVPELPIGVRAILERGSRKDPAQRYQTAEEMRQDLEHVLSSPEWSPPIDCLRAEDGLDSSAGPSRKSTVSKPRWLSRHGGKLVLISVALAAVAVVLLLTKARAPHALPNAPEPIPELITELKDPTFVELPRPPPNVPATPPSIQNPGQERMLQNLPLLYWESVASKFFPMEMGDFEFSDDTAIELPQRFLLKGTLSMVRVARGKTWLGLSAGSKKLTALVVFESAHLAALLADFRVGEKVQIVAVRTNWSAPQPSYYSRGSGFVQALGVEGLAMVSGSMQSHLSCFLSFEDGTSCLCFMGEALQKSADHSSWTMCNQTTPPPLRTSGQMPASPGTILREIPHWVGETGTFHGSFVDAQQVNNNLLVLLSITNSLESAFYLELDLGDRARLEELRDYQVGEQVLAKAVVRGGLGKKLIKRWESARPEALSLASLPKQMTLHREFHGASNIFENPFTVQLGITANCLAMQKPNRPNTLVTAQGPRRKPETAVALPPGDISKRQEGPRLTDDLEVTGTLSRLFAMEGEAHCVVVTDQKVYGYQVFEACTVEPDFMGAAADYLSNRERRGNGDEVRIVGTLWPGKSMVFRLERDAMMLQLWQMQRVGETNSLIVAGQPRDPRTLNTNRIPSALVQLLRDIPPVGTEVRFTGFFYDVYQDGRITIGPGRGQAYGTIVRGRPVVPVRFPSCPLSAWADYAQGAAPVEVVAVVRPPVRSISQLTNPPGWPVSRDVRVVFDATGAVPELEGRSIVRWKNPRSLVTSSGRAIPPTNARLEESRWVRRDINATNAQTFRIEARFDRLETKGQETAIHLEALFHGQNSLTISCPAVEPPARNFLEGLQRDEEIVCEIRYENLVTSYHMRQHTETLLWMARAAAPQARIWFAMASGKQGAGAGK